MPYVVRMDPVSQPSEPVRTRPEAPPVRPGNVVLAAVLTELVVIAALGNQWLAERDAHWIVNERSSLVRDFKIALLSLNWRFTPLSGDTQHTWLSQLLFIAITLVLTAAFVSLVVRGPATFGRIAVACWLAALGATTIASYVRALVNDQPATGGSRFEKTLFGPLSPSSVTVFACIVLALVTALVAASVTVLLRERADDLQAPSGGAPARAEPAYVAPEQPPPFFPDQRPSRPSPSGQPTTRFPRPPDDEDLGHVPE